MSFFWVIFSYLLGSFPSGYLISRACGKDILKIGWRKTSGSNVFKNVGKLQGALTGILDLAKGYLAVFGAQKLGLSIEIQIFSGVAAVTGHNWSFFLKFAGGRGIGTFIGAFLVISPQILGLSLIPLVLLALIWNAAIGTLLFLIIAILISIYLNQFEIAGIFTALSLAPILIKRLSPIEEIKKVQNKAVLIRNRLLFDNDKTCLDLRIKKIFKSKNPSKLSSVFKFLTAPLLLPSKAGWKVAKYGVKVAKKPLEKLLFPATEKVVTEIGIDDLKNIMIAAAKKIVLHQEEINKINVWPVADKDTGYNLAATLLGIEGVIGQREYSSIFELTRDIKEGAMTNARGNAGMIYTGYLIRVLDQIKNLDSINSLQLALAMKKGIKAAYRAILNPVEGTILDVISASGQKAYEAVKIKKERNIIKILEEAYKVSELALKETKEKLEALKEADVVDAGALGFVKILEAWIESLRGVTPPPEAKPPSSPFYEKKKAEEKPEYQYDLVFRIKKRPGLEKLKERLPLIGGSIDILEAEEEVKFHIHTNFPEKVRKKIRDFEILEWKVEDMAEQIRKITERKPLGLVVGQTAGLPKEFLEKYQIEEIPFKTSVPSFDDFLSAYKKALEKFEKILVITLSSKLSGSYSAARIARSMLKKPEKPNIFVFDSFTGEVGEGLVSIRAQELISQGKKIEEILNELKKLCPKVILLACLEDFRYVAHGGRFKLPKILIKPIFLIQKLGIRPLITLKNGKVKFLGIRFGRDMAKVLAKEIKRLQGSKEIRVAIAQTDNKKAAENLKRELERKPKVKILFISSVSPVVGIHTGPGTLIVGFYPVDN